MLVDERQKTPHKQQKNRENKITIDGGKGCEGNKQVVVKRTQG